MPSAPLDILIVDDDAPLREMLTRSFTREGHRTTAVADGAHEIDMVIAIGMLKSERYADVEADIRAVVAAADGDARARQTGVR